jgi:hypothetical protein
MREANARPNDVVLLAVARMILAPLGEQGIGLVGLDVLSADRARRLYLAHAGSLMIPSARASDSCGSGRWVAPVRWIIVATFAVDDRGEAAW